MRRGDGGLAGHHKLLVRRCADQREEAARYAGQLRACAVHADHGIAQLKRWALHPAAIAAGAVLILALGRSKTLRIIGATAGLIPPVLRLVGTAVAAGRAIRREAQRVPQ